MIHLAAAIARRHPAMAQGFDGPVAMDAVGVVERWAATLPDDMQLEFHGDEYGPTFEVHLSIAERQPAFLRPAFERANSIRAGLGWQLVKALDLLAYRHGLVLHPRSLFDIGADMLWMGETDDVGFEQQYVDMNWGGDEAPDPEEIAHLQGPDSYFDEFPGMPQEVARPGRSSKGMRKLHCAQRYLRDAARAKSDWECSLLLALAAASDFDQAALPGAWELMSNNGYEFDPVIVDYYIRWSDQDDMGYWADEVFNHVWDRGTALEAVLAFSFGNATRADVDALVVTIEACRDHRLVMDQLLEVLLQAGSENAPEIQ